MKPTLLLKGKASPLMLERLSRHFEVINSRDIDQSEDLFKRHREKVVALLTSQGADKALMDRLPHLKIISCNGVGYDAVDVNAAVAKNIIVTHTPHVLNQDVANTAIMMMLALSRRLLRDGTWIEQGKWIEKGSPPLTESIEGKRVGIYGLGRIGRALAHKLEAFNCQISYHCRRKVADLDYPYAESLLALAEDVDYLVIVVPANPSTYRTVDAGVLAALGKHGALINIARGSVVDEPALVSAISDGTLGAAALDVFEQEPHVPPALFHLDNVLLLPHVGSATVTTRKAMGSLAVDNIVDFILHGKPHTPVPECAAILPTLNT